ncbi:MAG: hypothetical protein R6W83_03315 [Cryobacterium sp.]
MSNKKKPQRAPHRMRSPKVVPPRPNASDAELPLTHLPVDFPDSLNSALSDPNPLVLLSYASSLLATIEPREAALYSSDPEDSGVTLREFCTGLDAAGLRQTDALLKVMTALSGDEMLRERIRRSVAARRHALPGWTLRLDQMRPHRAYELTHVLGDGENLVIAATLPDGREVSVMAYVDHNMGTVVKDAFVADQPVDRFLEAWEESRAEHEPESEAGDYAGEELSLPDARARLSAAIDTGARTVPPFETETWPGIRPLLEWVLAAIPAGGTGYVYPEFAEAQQAEIMERFLASPFGAARSIDENEMVATMVSLASERGPGDPLRWSPVAVEILLLDWIPGGVPAPRDFLARAPVALRALIRFADAERGISAQLTRQTLAAVDEFEQDYLDAIDDGVDGVDGDDGDDPLPDEEFDWAGIPTDVHERLSAVLALTDHACDALFDAELRTACRRLIARVAIGDPSIFRRRAGLAGAAACLVWMTARANEVVGRRGGVSTKQLAECLGLAGIPAQRSEPMYRALGVLPNRELGDPRLLTAAMRTGWARVRDRS